MTASPRLPHLADLPYAGRGPAPALANPVDADTTGTVLDRVNAWARKSPDRRAVVGAGGEIGYADLVRRVERMRARLEASGCGAGDVVACLGPRSARTIVLFLALESLGAVYLPVDPGWPRARIDEVLRLSSSALAVEYTAGDEQPPVVERTAGGGGGPLEAPAGEEPRYVIYTSGTTGRPKGAVVARPGMLNHLWAKVADLDITEDSRVVFTAPLVFDISIWQMLAPLMVGATVVVASDNDVLYPPRLHRLLLRHEATVVELVPTAIGTLLDDIARKGSGEVLPALRWLISTGEELKPSLAERALAALPHAGLLNAYGPTECSDDVTHHVVSPQDTAGARLPVGRPIGNAKIYCLVHDSEEGTWSAAGPGQAGELFVGGVPVGLGYLGDRDATLSAFFRDVFDPDSPTGRLYRTGDLGRIDGDGVHYLGRVDRQVKVAGVRMELDEIEAVLSRHGSVKLCAVTLRQEEGRQPVLTAHYVPGTEVEAGELEAFLRSALPASLVPRSWDRLEEMPLTPNGKVDHRALARREPPGEG
ncbi:amino acid adenylation domain-containing protein [Nocardiopsis tropica]|uniref:amino acid adenylation domain-containing protein n=1 Tax=Nocardiopsis tropica TaxID=109330 RepID=UPI002E88B3C8|nr:amino acid adenylation domain-containing protein [Nocardiopsis tropica]